MKTEWHFSLRITQPTRDGLSDGHRQAGGRDKMRQSDRQMERKNRGVEWHERETNMAIYWYTRSLGLWVTTWGEIMHYSRKAASVWWRVIVFIFIKSEDKISKFRTSTIYHCKRSVSFKMDNLSLCYSVYTVFILCIPATLGRQSDRNIRDIHSL